MSLNKKNFTYGLRIAATADVTSLVDFEQSTGAVEGKWFAYGAGLLFSGKELKDFYNIDKGNRKRDTLYWRRLDGSVIEVAKSWKQFKKLTRVELESRNLTNAVRERRIARRIVVLRVVAVVGAIAYGAATRDIQGAIGIVKIGNQLADSLADGNLSIQDIAGLVQATGEQLGVDIEGEIREQMTAAGVSKEDQDELIAPLLGDLDAYNDEVGSSDSTRLLLDSGVVSVEQDIGRLRGQVIDISLGGGASTPTAGDLEPPSSDTPDEDDGSPIGIIAGALGVGLPLGFALLSLIF